MLAQNHLSGVPPVCSFQHIPYLLLFVEQQVRLDLFILSGGQLHGRRHTRAWGRGSWAALEQGTGSLSPGGNGRQFYYLGFGNICMITCICTAGQSGGGAAGSILCLLPRHGSSVQIEFL